MEGFSGEKGSLVIRTLRWEVFSDWEVSLMGTVHLW